MFCNPLMTKVDNFKDFVTAFWVHTEDFVEKLKCMSAEIIHVHNEPDWMVWVAKETCPDKVVVYDVHDLDSVRVNRISNDEIKAMQACDGLIFTSPEYQREVNRIHGELIERKPQTVVYSYVNEDFFVEPEQFLLPKVPGVVYEGWARFPADDDPAESENNMPFTNQKKVVQALSEAGIPSYWYGVEGNNEYLRFMQFGAHPMLIAPYASLMRLMSKYDWGIFGVEDKFLQMDTTMPNKVFEYLAAGLPVIVVNAKAAGEFIEKNGFGVVLNSYRDIRTVFDRSAEFKANVMAKRKDFTMENQVGTIMDLYRRAAAYSKKRGQDAKG
jgi:hypothetical protein